MPHDPVPGDDNLSKEMDRRVLRAETDRNRHKGRIADCYRYTMPWRHGFDQSQAVDHLDEIFDETAGTVLEDFSADMLNTFTPQNSDWLDMKSAEAMDVAANRQIEEHLRNYQRVLFAEMLRSNLYQALQESYLDLGPGTMALTIQDINPAEPIHCQAIPMTELLIDRGPYGYVDGRWRKWKCRADEIRVLWPNAIPPDNSLQWRDGDTTEWDVIDGVWRDWTDRGTERYQYCVKANGKIIYKEVYLGQGSCPMIVARWARDSTTAWGMGPTYRVLPAIKTLNHVSFLNLKNLDKVVDPVTAYQDDGVMNLDNGVDPGTWLPYAVGSELPAVIESKGRFDVAWSTKEDLVSAIKRAHYQDRPDQLGKTPPSATQWADEAAERQRRMGTPATNLVLELQYPIVKRFAYLLEKRGVLPKIELNGRQVALTPVSPLLRAQGQEELVRIVRHVEIVVAQYGPQLAAVITDPVVFAVEVGRILGTSKINRKEADIKAAIEQLLPVLKTASGGGKQLDPAQLVGPQG